MTVFITTGSDLLLGKAMFENIRIITVFLKIFIKLL